jgi:hypothetical protein
MGWDVGVGWDVMDDNEGGVEMLTYNRGQYSDAVLNELESQNDQQVEGILGKVRLLKDVSLDFLSLLPLRLSCEEHWADLWCDR